MPTPIHVTQSFYICSFLASHAVPGPSLLSLEGAPRGLLEGKKRGKGSIHRLKHFALMPECDLLCNNRPSTGDTCAVLPSKASCARQNQPLESLWPVTCSFAPARCCWLALNHQPALDPSRSHQHSLGARCMHLWWLGETPVPALVPGLCSTPETTGITSSVYTRVTQRRDGTEKKENSLLPASSGEPRAEQSVENSLTSFTIAQLCL